MSADAVIGSLRALFQRGLAIRDRDYFEIDYDPEWRSDCELGVDPTGNLSQWRPVPQQPEVDFSGLASALELVIHEDIQAYYGSFWAGNVETRSEEGHVSLIQLWNLTDFDRLIANLIGHALTQQRSRQPFTVFFANTEPESELFLSIDNESGSVLLEEPGKPPIREVETDVASFLDRLTPIDAPPTIY